MPIRFQVDADFYDHPKTTGMSDAAFSLWVRAGSFSAGKLTDGFIAEDVLALTLRSSTDVADELVRRGLWRRCRGGWRFHQWGHRNLTKTRVETDREADRIRKRQERHSKTNNATPHVNGTNVRPDTERNPDGIQRDSDRSPERSVSVSVSESVSGSGQARASPVDEPPRTCPRHLDDPDPPACGPCGDARRNHDRWEANRNARQAAAPKCRLHRGQPAHNCALCRADQLAADPEGATA
jgi:hypothetical protein